MGISDDLKRLLRESRDENFGIRIEEKNDGVYGAILHLSVTTSGSEWSSIRLTPDEARKVAQALLEACNG